MIGLVHITFPQQNSSLCFAALPAVLKRYLEGGKEDMGNEEIFITCLRYILYMRHIGGKCPTSRKYQEIVLHDSHLRVFYAQLYYTGIIYLLHMGSSPISN